MLMIDNRLSLEDKITYAAFYRELGRALVYARNNASSHIFNDSHRRFIAYTVLPIEQDSAVYIDALLTACGYQNAAEVYLGIENPIDDWDSTRLAGMVERGFIEKREMLKLVQHRQKQGFKRIKSGGFAVPPVQLTHSTGTSMVFGPKSILEFVETGKLEMPFVATMLDTYPRSGQINGI